MRRSGSERVIHWFQVAQLVNPGLSVFPYPEPSEGCQMLVPDQMLGQPGLLCHGSLLHTVFGQMKCWGVTAAGTPMAHVLGSLTPRKDLWRLREER